jgi:hypothetical protein
MRHAGHHTPRDLEEDRACFVKWRRGVVVFYGAVALIALVVFLASRLFGH